MAITGEKRDTLERWLFAGGEPPFPQSYTRLTEEYRQNLEDLHRAEEADWVVSELAATPDEIREVVQQRLRWLAGR